jgi:growth arrest-specific protein 8
MPPKSKPKPPAGKGGKGKPTGKPPKLTIEEEAKAKADAVNDIDDEDYKKSLRLECRTLEKMARKEDDLAGLYQDERQRVNYFWIVAKKEMEDK